jgi:hypothetical protein
LPSFRQTFERKNMMGANYRHIGAPENSLGRHYSVFDPRAPRFSITATTKFAEPAVESAK